MCPFELIQKFKSNQKSRTLQVMSSYEAAPSVVGSVANIINKDQMYQFLSATGDTIINAFASDEIHALVAELDGGSTSVGPTSQPTAPDQQ